MKKSYGILGIIVLIILCCLWAKGAYNGMVSNQEAATKAWANVQSAYQRRADLIPNLVETVKGYAKHEQETFENVVEARAKATQITVDPTNLTPEKLQEFQAAQGELTSALGRLIAVGEAFPVTADNVTITYTFKMAADYDIYLSAISWAAGA